MAQSTSDRLGLVHHGFNPSKGIPIILSIIAVYNTVLVILCLTASATVQYDYSGFYNPRYTFMGEGERYAIIFLYFCTIPLTVCTISYLDLFKRWRHTLRPLRMVITSIFGMLALAICPGIWSPCIYTKWRGGHAKHWYSPWWQSPTWCPIGAGPKWVEDRNGHHSPSPNVAYLLPWAIILSEVL